MKYLKFIFFVLAIVFICSPQILAKSITNNNGIVFSEEEYNNFLKVHNHEYLMNIDEAKYERLKELNYNDIKTTTKYVLTGYNSQFDAFFDKEVTEEEYNKFTNTIDKMVKNEEYSIRGISNDSTYYETTGKRITMIIVGGGYWNYVTLTCNWKMMPATRSYDVIGIRGNGIAVRNGSQTGEQMYRTNGNFKSVYYSWNGTNIKRFDNGFGISMNLVDNSINYLQLDIAADIRSTTTHPEVFGSYQHAVTNISLANSKNYTLGGTGLGGVFVFPSSLTTKFDQMAGLRIRY